MKRLGITLLLVYSLFPVLAQQNIDLLATAGKTNDIRLSEIATSIRTVQLETTDDCLLVPEQMSIYYGKEYIFAFDGTDPGNYYRFTLDGKFINRIGKPGPGPGEYQEGYHFIVDEEKNEFWIQDWRSFAFHVYTLDGKFKRKVPIEKSVFLNAESALIGDQIIYINCHFYRSPNAFELLRANAVNGKLLANIKSTAPKNLNVRLIYSRSVLYTYQNKPYYINTFDDTIHFVSPDMKLIPAYNLNLGKINNQDKNDRMHAITNVYNVSLRKIYEKDDFMLFSYYYKGKTYWSVCSKKDWKCRNIDYEVGFINDLEPNGKPFVCSYHNSESKNHLIGYIPDEIGEDNPAIIVVELK